MWCFKCLLHHYLVVLDFVVVKARRYDRLSWIVRLWALMNRTECCLFVVNYNVADFNECSSGIAGTS